MLNLNEKKYKDYCLEICRNNRWFGFYKCRVGVLVEDLQPKIILSILFDFEKWAKESLEKAWWK